jgi:hypothetical protein
MLPTQKMCTQVRQALARDPKRTAIMTGLGLVMLALWGRMLLSGPASATASLIRRSVLSVGESINPSRSPTVSTPVLEWLGKPKEPVSRNLFAMHLDYYAKAIEQKPATDLATDPVSLSDESDEQRERQILIENLQTQASKLKLQSTMMGGTPQALINGQLVKTGDVIAGFTVDKIQARCVQIQQDGISLQIEMP